MAKVATAILHNIACRNNEKVRVEEKNVINIINNVEIANIPQERGGRNNITRYYLFNDYFSTFASSAYIKECRN